jgi:hypothetical protein
MDEQAMTAWEELNGRQFKPCPTLERLRRDVEQAQAALAPCALSEAMRLLTPNLMLCSPSGMTEADRVEWLKAAIMTIGDIPHDLLERACLEGRKKCDHPAKIVPFICQDVERSISLRKTSLRNAREALDRFTRPKAPALTDERQEDRSCLAQEVGALAREMERKAQMSVS